MDEYQVSVAPVEWSDLDEIKKIESTSYPADEAASERNLELRASEARPFFLVAKSYAKDGTSQIVGYVCGTLTDGDELTEDSMGSHNPLGHHLLVHSVVTSEAHRRKGLATWLFRQYLRLVQSWSTRCVPNLDAKGSPLESVERPDGGRQLERASLLTKKGNIDLYKRCGFVLLGPSKVVHGADLWYDMTRSLAPPSTDACIPRSSLAIGAAQLPFCVLDAFSTGRPTTGNPAAVVLLPPGAGVSSLEHLLARRMRSLSSTTASGGPGASASSGAGGSDHAASLAWLLSESREKFRGEWYDWAQRITIEFNLSETAFVRQFTATEAELLLKAEQAVLEAERAAGAARKGDALLRVATSRGEGEASYLPGAWSLRWFTPGTEVDLCGHATLASAGALWKSGSLPEVQKLARFVSLSGPLEATRIGGDGGVSGSGDAAASGQTQIQLDFPTNAAEDVSEKAGASDEAGVIASGLGLQREALKFHGRNVSDVLVEVSPEDFAGMKPDVGQLAKVDCRGVVVTSAWEEAAASSAGASEPPSSSSSLSFKHAVASATRHLQERPTFASRFFGPRCGVDEDPVTGSAHTMLCPYWESKARGGTASGEGSSKEEEAWQVGFQASKRGGVVRCRTTGNGRTLLQGAVVVASAGLLAEDAVLL